MADKTKPEVSPQKRSLKLSPALGDWTTYKAPKQLVKRVKIGLYGFDRLSEEELNWAHLIHYRFAEVFTSELKVNLGIGSELYSVEAYQNTYGNFLKGLLGPLYQARIKLPEYHDEVLLTFDLPVLGGLIGNVLGVSGTEVSRSEMTDADIMVAETTLNEYLKTYIGVFEGAVKNAALETVGSPDPTPNSALNTQNTFVYFVIEVSFNEAHGKIVLGYSGQLIKKILNKMKEIARPRSLPLNKLTKDMLQNIEVSTNIVLGKTALTTADIKKLEVGDVVSLDGSIKSAITLKLEDRVVVLGQPGIMNGHMVARVVGIEKEKEVKIAPPVKEEPAKEEPVRPATPPAAAKPAVKPAVPAAKPSVAPPPLKPSFGGFGKRAAPPPPPIEEEEFDEDLDEEFLDEELEDEFEEDLDKEEE